MMFTMREDHGGACTPSSGPMTRAALLSHLVERLGRDEATLAQIIDTLGRGESVTLDVDDSPYTIRVDRPGPASFLTGVAAIVGMSSEDGMFQDRPS